MTMRFRLILGVLLLSLIQASGAVAAAPDFKALMRKELDAWETLDPTKVAAFYAKDADNTFFDLAPLKYKGWAEYEEGAKKVLADFASVKFTINDDAQVHQHGNLGWATATFHADFVTKSGGKEPMDARWTLVWEKRGKDWLIVHEHVSVPLPPAAAADQPLYKRLGGYDALAAVTDDFIPRLVHDPQLAKYFIGHSTESLHRIRQLVVDQLCAATGGPCLYVGRDMKSAHAGLGITESDWQAAANHLVESLDKFNVPEKEKKEVLDLVSTLKKDIVAAER
jgi:hemoglobin